MYTSVGIFLVMTPVSTFSNRMWAMLQTVSGAGGLRLASGLFTDRVLGDPFLAPSFAGLDPQRVRVQLRAFLNASLGCVDVYNGSVPGNDGFRLTAAEFERMSEHLSASLCEAGMATELAEALAARLEPLRQRLVTG
jgi:truncated hemoglobin YjbI